MRSLASATLLASVVAHGGVRYDAATHVPRQSAGCGRPLPTAYAAGSTVSLTGKFAGVQRSWRVFVPASYTSSTAYPLVLDHHGWTGTANTEESISGIAEQASAEDFIAVWPQGMADNTRNGSWGSWNTVGSTLSPGPAGATCTSSAGTQDNCYTSCGNCSDSPQCWWTTCDADVTESGVGTDLDGFLPSLYDLLEVDLCIDTSREYATGKSNGAMMTYQLGVSLGMRLAAIVPVAGSFHNGFAQTPVVGVPLMDIHGTLDTTVPANVTNGAGWYYTVTSEIFGGNQYSQGWKAANGCSGAAGPYPTPYDGTSSLYCVSEGNCSGGDVVRCMWEGAHIFISVNGPLVWGFLSQWTKPSHVGFGCSDGGPCHRKSQNIAVLRAAEQSPQSIFEGISVLTPAVRGHYGDPVMGCLADEAIIPLAGGHTCAPRIDSSLSLRHERSPLCKFGDAFPIKDNGCPTDADVMVKSAAWPACVAKGNSTDPYTLGEFHCVLVCGPCNQVDLVTSECEEEAHQMCPTGAKCKLGELRAVTYGICSFDIAARQVAI